MLMTVLISDASRSSQELSPQMKNPDMVNELLYADDTLVIAFIRRRENSTLHDVRAS